MNYYLFNENNKCYGVVNDIPNKSDLAVRKEFYIEDPVFYDELEHLTAQNGIIINYKETDDYKVSTMIDEASRSIEDMERKIYNAPINFKGGTFDADEESIRKMAYVKELLLVNKNESTPWVDCDNKIIELNKKDLTVLLKSVMERNEKAFLLKRKMKDFLQVTKKDYEEKKINVDNAKTILAGIIKEMEGAE